MGHNAGRGGVQPVKPKLVVSEAIQYYEFSHQMIADLVPPVEPGLSTASLDRLGRVLRRQIFVVQPNLDWHMSHTMQFQ